MWHDIDDIVKNRPFRSPMWINYPVASPFSPQVSRPGAGVGASELMLGVGAPIYSHSQ